MKKLLLFVTIFFFNFLRLALAQSVINAGNDTAICMPGSIVLHASLGSLAPVELSNAASPMGDDVFSPVVANIGFPFTFFGNTYTQCVISSNCYISFNTNLAGGYSPWQIVVDTIDSLTVPGGPTQIFNSIMSPWQDLNPANGGTIRYATIGNAPNRVFVVEYCSVTMYSCTSLQFNSQIQLFENGSVIETHLIDKPLCVGSNGGQAIHGIQNANGTIAFVNAGRNGGVQWTANNEGTRFAPNPLDPNNYFISSVPFAPLTLGVSGVITWTDTAGNNVGTGSSVTIIPNVANTYIATVNDFCSGNSFSDSVTVNAGPLPNLSFSYANPTMCIGAGTADAVLGVGSVGTFSAYPSGLIFNNIQTGSINLATSLPGTYTIKRIASNTGCADTLTFIVHLTNTPNASFSYSGTVYCTGASNPTPLFINGANPGVFSASPQGLQFSSSSTGEIDFNASTPGTYTITNTINGTGCPLVSDTSIITLATQNIDAGLPLQACLGTPLQLNPTVTGPNNNNVQWSGGFGSFSNSSILSPLYNPAQADVAQGSITLVLLTQGSPTCPSLTDSVQVSVINGATVNAGTNQSFCSGGAPVVLNGSIGGIATSGSWSTNGTGFFGSPGALSTIYFPSATDVSNGAVNLILTSNDPPGACPSNTDTLTLSFFSQPTAIAQLQSNAVCEGSEILLDAYYTGNITAFNWTTNGSGNFINTSGQNVVYVPGSSDLAGSSIIFTLNANAQAPCANVNDNIIVDIQPNPTATINPVSNTELCSGDTLELNANIATGQQYQWMYNGVDILGATTPNYLATQGGNYTLMVTNNSGCSALSNNITLNELVNQFIQQPANTSCNIGSDTLFFVEINNAATYQWQENQGNGFFDLSNNNNFYGVNNDTLFILDALPSMDNNTYRCIVATTNGCILTSNSAVLDIDNSMGIRQGFSDRLILAPNPATSYFNVSAPYLQTLNLEINDASGRLVKQMKGIHHQQKIIVDDLPEGVYHIQLTNTDGISAVKKLIVLRRE